MPNTLLDNRQPLGVIATKGNIVPDDSSGNALSKYLHGESAQFFVEGVDASAAASAVVTVDVPAAGSGAVAADSGAVAADGEYAFYVEITHPSAAAANRRVIVQHRDAANAVTLENIAAVLAGAGKQIFTGKRQLRASERIRLLTGTDATNVNIAVKFLFQKLS